MTEMSGEKDKIREQLSAYLDGELSDEEARRVEAALKSDSELQAELDELRRVREMVGSLPSSQAPEGFVERVMARAERERLMSGDDSQSHRGGPLRWARLLATAAVLLVAAGAGLVLISSLVFTETPGWDNGEGGKVGEIARDRGSDDEKVEESEKRQPAAEGNGGEESFAETGGRSRDRSSEPAPRPEPEEPESADRPESPRRVETPEPAEGDSDFAFATSRREDADMPVGDELEQRVTSQSRNMDLYVSDVVEANEKVIGVLNRRGIVVEPPEGNGRASEAQWTRNYSRPRAAFANNLAEQQVQIVAFVPSGEVPELLSELRQAAPSEDGEVLKLRVREAASAPVEAYTDSMPSGERKTGETREREGLLRRQLDRQTAIRAAGDTENGQDGAYDVRSNGKLAETLPTSRALVAADVEPLLINLLDINVIRENLRENLEQSGDGEQVPRSQPASDN
ncbi:MAG: anti-sigma factor family protein [Phycisphaerae bacterium]